MASRALLEDVTEQWHGLASILMNIEQGKTVVALPVLVADLANGRPWTPIQRL